MNCQREQAQKPVERKHKGESENEESEFKPKSTLPSTAKKSLPEDESAERPVSLEMSPTETAIQL
jgi:hypothetical protein